jgi:hypothetical protein
MPPLRHRPDIDHTREALRDHDENTEEPPELPHPVGDDDEDEAGDEED